MSSQVEEAPGAAVARNLQRLRAEQGVSLSALARASGIGKATLSALETGQGNPTIETLWALATALGVPFSELMAQPRPDLARVVRRADAVRVQGSAGVARLMDRIIGRGLVEVYDMHLEPGQRHTSAAHAPGTTEHVLVASGRVLAGPEDDPVDLDEGDLAVFAADQPHVYHVPGGPARITVLMSYG